VLALLLAGGCVPLQQLLDPDSVGPATAVVPSNPFGDPAPAAPATQASYTPPTQDTGVAMRVDRVGHKILAANPQAGLQPVFATYGTSKPEIFHQGTKSLHITDALVNQCKTDGQLAAVLSLELARMVAERQALNFPKANVPEQRPPIDVPIGNAGQVGGGAVDQARLVELARYDKRRRDAAKAAAPLDPEALAVTYLESAGYARGDLEAVRPLLRAAAGNYVLEKQLKTSGAAGWTSPSP
jgi:hypothetical protein